jgi:hypothetical protein
MRSRALYPLILKGGFGILGVRQNADIAVLFRLGDRPKALARPGL